MFVPIVSDDDEPIDSPVIEYKRCGVFADKPSDFRIGKAMPHRNETGNTLDDFGGTAEVYDENSSRVCQFFG